MKRAVKPSPVIEPTDQSSGIPYALRFIEQNELRWRGEVEASDKALLELMEVRSKNSPKHDGRDWKSEIDAAEERRDMAQKQWDFWSDKLHDFDPKVSERRRVAGEKLSKEDVVSSMTMFVTCIRLSVEDARQRICADVALCETPVDADKRTRDSFSNALIANIENFSGKEDESILPRWACEAMKAGL